jgi:hypothetical protein
VTNPDGTNPPQTWTPGKANEQVNLRGALMPALTSLLNARAQVRGDDITMDGGAAGWDARMSPSLLTRWGGYQKRRTQRKSQRTTQRKIKRKTQRKTQRKTKRKTQRKTEKKKRSTMKKMRGVPKKSTTRRRTRTRAISASL